MKDAYYFPHDSNAKDDPKIVIMLEQHGLEAYGIYWILIETLRDQTDFRAPMAIVPGLARRYNTTAEKIKSVIMGYGLFEIHDDEFFLSISLNRRMDAINDRRKKLSEAGKKGNLKRWNDKDLITTLSPSDRNPIASKGKESKEKEIKVNKSTYSEEFERAWNMYGRKGSKTASYQEWKKTTQEDKEVAMNHIPQYVEANRQEPQYMKDFERYLKNQTYYSAIIERTRKNTFSGGSW